MKALKFKITKALHVTPTERKHLGIFLSTGKTSAKINTKIYEVIKGSVSKDTFYYTIRILTPYISELTGQREFNQQTIELEVKK